MEVPRNLILRRIDLPNWLDLKERLNENQLIVSFQAEQPRDEERYLNELFYKTCETVVTGYAWLNKVYLRTGRKTFLPAMRYVPEYHRLSELEQTELHTRSAQVKHIYEHWDEIVSNCMNSSMTHIDVRRMNLYQLSRASDKNWLTRHNDSQKPKVKRRIDRVYTNLMIQTLADNCVDIMRVINNDEEQIRLIGRDLANALLKRAENKP